jgi:hypothetical protein
VLQDRHIPKECNIIKEFKIENSVVENEILQKFKKELAEKYEGLLVQKKL